MSDASDAFPAAALDQLARRPARAARKASWARSAPQLREYLIRSVATRGGHFAAGLGTVELTVALHYVFDTPHDRLVWDVGHQAYPHKVLTGRRDQLDTIKQSDGLAPFPSRAESEYDTFGVGHSSTSISAALGMAVAAELEKADRKVVAIIGDGAMTAGMAWEALLNAGVRKTNLLVVLNDNDMSISENVGALSNYFAKVLSGRMYSTLAFGRQEDPQADAHDVGAGAPLRRNDEGHGIARHDLRGAGLQLHRPDGWPRHQGAGGHAAQHAQSQGPAAAARGHARRARVTTPRRRTRSSGTARVRSIRSAAPSSRKRPPALATRRSSASGCATWRRAIRASSASRPRCAKARGWSNTRRSFRSAISTWRSPSSTP